jgi:beta-phosphoglucomutase
VLFVAAFAAVIFDVDGVLVDSPHERAWRETLEELMRGPWSDVKTSTSYAPERFDSALYQQLVSGKPRDSGALAILEFFGIPDVAERAVTYAREKQSKLVALIDAGQFRVFPDAVPFVMDTIHLGLPIAAASSSKNAGKLLASIPVEAPEVSPHSTLHDLFDVDISGRDFVQGKPHPEIFLAAARELHVRPDEVVVVEDAVSGIAAAKSGGMLAIGVARHGDDAALQTAHADLVVRSLDDVSRLAMARGQLEPR